MPCAWGFKSLHPHKELMGYPSGQRRETVNLLRKLRGFESYPLEFLFIKADRL